MKYTITDIQYDTDGEDVKLPSELTINVPEEITEPEEIDDYISDEISNVTGFCHKGFSTNPEINY